MKVLVPARTTSAATRSARSWRARMFLAHVVAGIAACTGGPGSALADQIGTLEGQDHPICRQARQIRGMADNICGVLQLKDQNSTGKLWGQEKFNASHVSFDGITEATFVLLGEVHDNPVHHQLRAGLIAQRNYDNPAPTAVVFEHIRADQQETLTRYFAEIVAARNAWSQNPARSGRPPAPEAQTLLQALEWDRSGWPSARMFEPLFSRVLSLPYPIQAGEPPRGQVRAVAKDGFNSIASDARERMLLDRPLPAPLVDAVRTQLKASHCGMLPESAIPGMAAAQFYRDAYMADAMIGAAGEAGSAILLAGNGHLRTDRGVPWHLRQRKPGSTMLTIMPTEVRDGENDPAAYVPRDPDGKPAVDYIVFTLRARRDDPCEKMRQHMQNRKG